MGLFISGRNRNEPDTDFLKCSGFPPLREIREFREKSGKKSAIREIREFREKSGNLKEEKVKAFILSYFD